MNKIKVNDLSDIPKNFTGIAEFPSGEKWYKEGKYHREDGPAIEWIDGSKFWYKNDKLHREDGPAREFPNGKKCWYKEGERHREDGPAIEWADGDKAWYLEDIEYKKINLKNYVILDSYQGNYNLMWYKLLDEDKVFEYPDIQGLIEK